MVAFFKSRWLLFIVLCVFVACKVPHLYAPYYWDESWPYATAIKAMFEHGLSLMPGAIDPEISRGHPLFFHVLAAGWMKVFGGSHFAMHSFALLISLFFLVAVYECALKLFNPRAAAMALLLVATQEVFFVQSSMVLFEMLVALLCFLSLWCYVKDKYVLTALCLVALFYTKESGLIMGFVLGLDALAGIFNKSISRRTIVARLLSVGVPCLLIGLFFVTQKMINGWYIFPFYSQIIEHSWKAFWYKFRMCCVSDAFYASLKYYYFVLLLLVAIVAAVKNKRWRYLALFIPAFFIYYFVNDMRAGRILPSIPFFILFVAGWFGFLRLFSHTQLFPRADQRRFFVLTGCFVLCFLCFSTMNYYTYRYLLAVIVPVLFIAAALFDLFISRLYRQLYYVVIACFAVISYFAFTTNKGFGDADLSAFEAMQVQQEVVSYMESKGYYDAETATGGYVAMQHLKDPATGYLKTQRRFPKVGWAVTPNTRFVIFNNIEPDYRYNDTKADTSFALEYRFQKGAVWAEIYKRK